MKIWLIKKGKEVEKQTGLVESIVRDGNNVLVTYTDGSKDTRALADFIKSPFENFTWPQGETALFRSGVTTLDQKSADELKDAIIAANPTLGLTRDDIEITDGPAVTSPHISVKAVVTKGDKFAEITSNEKTETLLKFPHIRNHYNITGEKVRDNDLGYEWSEDGKFSLLHLLHSQEQLPLLHFSQVMLLFLQLH